MKIPFNYLPLEFNKKYSNKIFSKWKKLIKSSEFTLGPFMESFEMELAKYVGIKYCLATNNGTDALILSLKAFGIKEGDEIITPANSFYATTGAIVAVGAIPIMCDVDDNYQICINDMESKISKKTKALLPVHWGGASPDMYKIMSIARKYKLKVIEDSCMAIGGKIKGKSPGTFGDIGAYSMHPLKSLNVMGDGGAVVTNNRKIYLWMKKYRNHGMVSRDIIEMWGVNYRMQPLQAIVAEQGLKKLNSVINLRKKNFDFLQKHLKDISGIISIPEEKKGFRETHALYMILCKKRDQLKNYLIKNSIEVKIHYPIPLHMQPAYLKKYKKIKLKNTEFQAKHLLTLPIHQFLNLNHMNFIVKKIKEFYDIEQI